MIIIIIKISTLDIASWLSAHIGGMCLVGYLPHIQCTLMEILLSNLHPRQHIWFTLFL